MIDYLFKPGQILLVHKIVYYHACVYLGKGEIIHVENTRNSSDNASAMSRRFKIDTFKSFIGNWKRIKIIEVAFLLMSDEEIKERAKMLNKESFRYDLVEENCEHLAFYCVTGFKYST
jgi:hypothetical protein